MKTIVLGGAGVEGSYVVKRLSNGDIFSDIVVADINEKKGKEISAKYDKVEYVKLDILDEKELMKTLNDADVVVNCVGPFYKFAPVILEAAIKKGVDIVDICDDYDITEKLIDDYNKKAMDAGVTSIVGLGASPGITNIITAFTSNILDTVEDITIYVTRGIKEEAGLAIPYHMMHCWLGEIPVFLNGKFERKKGLADGEEYVNFPAPFGQTPVYYFGHPETVTLPRYIKGVKNVACKGTFYPPEFRSALLNMHSAGLTSEEPINVLGNEIKPVDFLAGYIGSLAKKMQMEHTDIPSAAAVMVKVTGEKDSMPRTYQFAGVSRMKEGTATPASIGAEMIVKNEIKSPGVQAPEACIPPVVFISRLLQEENFGDTWLTVNQKITDLSALL